MKFSKRTGWNLEESDLARAVRERQAAGLTVLDLTASNPTRCGFEYPPELLSALSDPAVLDYDPDPRGSLRARESVCRYYADHGAVIDPGQVILTTSTSEAYGYLFKLLCNPGDSVLAPQPSYPLFDFLAQAECVELAQAPLLYDHGWQLDMEGLRRAITVRSRAVVLVHPNNPTGHFTKHEEARELASICGELALALIVDEVFLDYGIDRRTGEGTASSPSDRASFAAWELPALTFIVSGISKICGLPQMKAAWLVALGPGADEALKRLEIVGDTYLSMNAPVQYALPHWLEARAGMQAQIRERVAGNLTELDRALAAQPSGAVLVSRLAVEGGWYAVLRIPALQPDDITAIELLHLGVLVHPGYFFGMGPSGWLVVSLLARAEDFSIGTSIVLSYIDRNQESYHGAGMLEHKY